MPTRSPCSKKNGVTTSTPKITRYDASPPATPVEKAARWNSLRSSIGAPAWCSRATKATTSTAPTASEATMPGEAQPSRSPDDTAPMSTAMAGTKMARPAQSKRARSARWRRTVDEQPRGYHPEQADRHVHQEDQPPSSDGQQQPADRWAEGQTERLGGALDADGPAERTRRYGQVDDGHAVGLQHRRPDGLQGPGPVQYHEIRRQAAEGRADDEDAEAVGVDEQLAPDHVGQAPHGGNGGHEHQQVAEADPGHGGPSWRERPPAGWGGPG